MTALSRILTSAWMPAFIGKRFSAHRYCCESKREALAVFASHDMRSPMATVRDAASLLVEGALGEVNEKQRRLLTIILERTETWLRLVDEVLVLPRWVGEGSPLHLREESLRDVTCEAIEKTKGLALLREVTLNVTIPDAFPKIVVDRLRLVQALTILLAAVISSAKQGGQVRLSAALLSENEVRATVSSVGTARTFAEGGVMSSVRAVVEAHGGRFCIPFDEVANGICSIILPLQVSASSKERSHVQSTHH